jgi:TPR repeat protein
MSLAPSEGKPDEDDYPVIVENLEKAADAGHVPAMFRLGEIYDIQGEWGKQKEYAKAKKYYQLAERNGSLRAKRRLAILYLTGPEAKKKSQLALKTLEECAKDGDSECHFKLFDVYYDAVPSYKEAGIMIDRKKGLLHLALAAELGHPNALCLIGVGYFYGEVVQQDKKRAMDLFRIAADKGSECAINVLEKIKGEENVK